MARSTQRAYCSKMEPSSPRWEELTLFRDYLRASPEPRRRYEKAKRALAGRDWPTVDHYADAKGDTIWSLIREADRWAWEIAWSAGPSDA